MRRRKVKPAPSKAPSKEATTVAELIIAISQENARQPEYRQHLNVRREADAFDRLVLDEIMGSRKVLYFGTQSSFEELKKRLLRISLAVQQRNEYHKRKDIENLPKVLTASLKRPIDKQLICHDDPGLTMDGISLELGVFKRKIGGLGLVVIESLDTLTPPHPKTFEAYGMWMASLNGMAKGSRVSIVTTCQYCPPVEALAS